MRREPTAHQRNRDRLFEYRGFWLGREVGSDYIFYYWYDEAKRRTRRKTTGQQDLEKAKEYLVELALAHPPDSPLDPKNVTLKAVEKFYFLHHAHKIRSLNAAKRAFKLVRQYLLSALASRDPVVADFDIARQEGFMLWARDKHGLGGKTISTYLSTIKAALRFCAKPRLVRDSLGQERVAQILATAPYINDNEAEIATKTNLPRSAPRDDIPTDAEMAAFIAAAHEEHIFRFVIMALNTWARPEAVVQLGVRHQVDFQRGLVHLNQPGRVQNKKIRPTIRLTDNLRGWLLHWNIDRPVLRKGQAVARVDNRTLAKVAKAAGLSGKVTKYTFRHYMATRIRSVDGITVSREERATWMGHTDPHHRTTEAWYESMDADYLVSAMRATDAILTRLQTLCARRALFAPNAVAGTGLYVVGGRAALPLGKSEPESGAEGA
jgi:hypothetical protein